MISLGLISQGDRYYYSPKCAGGENLARPLPGYLCFQGHPFGEEEGNIPETYLVKYLSLPWRSINFWDSERWGPNLAFLSEEIKTPELLFAPAARGLGSGHRACKEPSRGVPCFHWRHYLLDTGEQDQDRKAVFPRCPLPWKALRISCHARV